MDDDGDAEAEVALVAAAAAAVPVASLPEELLFEDAAAAAEGGCL